ncbi:cytochrome C [Methylococcus geothermalis]|uniref:cytochrome C n=1 Tax=Methylococcus geothermalis TaxID=2681310 RepID=UPI001E5A4BB8|nr:cytochrome C [Methylococcus geothermalis]
MHTLRPFTETHPFRGLILGGSLLALASLLAPQAVLAAAKIKISKAAWSEKAGTLTIKGSAKGNSGPVDVYDINGRRLGGGQGDGFALTLSRQDLAGIPCAVRVQSGDTEAIKPVKGAPKSCSGAPACSIVSPGQGAAIQVGVDTHFEATATAKDPAAQPFAYQWDFAGGAMGELIAGTNPPAYKRPDTLSTMVAFVRNDSRYRVRFIATDAKGRRCEDAVEVVVGSPPTGLPAKVSEQPAPKLGAELDGTKGDVVVLPFEEWTYQNLSDMRYGSNGYGSFSPTVNNIRAYAFKKDRLPVFLDDSAVELRYSAASNPNDPVGGDSINSTSHNWPTTAALLDAALKKTDVWEIPTRPDAQKAEGYFACSWMMTGYWGGYGCGDAQGLPTVDEGYFKAKKDDAGAIVSDDPNTDQGHGAYMPGRENPYFANSPQPFSKFVANEKSRKEGVADKPAGWFEANLLPYTDTDDQGRVNPFSLVRVEAVAKGSNGVLAKTDGVVSAGRDFHCRECHAKGKVGANPNAPYTKAAFASSAWGKYGLEASKTLPGYSSYAIPDEKIPERPEFFDVSDIGGDPASIFDQEYAAALNYSSLHQYYDIITFLNDMMYAVSKTYLSDDEKQHPANIEKDTPRPCYGCHATALSFDPFKNSWWDEDGFKVDDSIYAPNYSIAMHRFHGELQWNANKTDIVRDAKGAHVRWDWKTKGPNDSTKTGSLFPIFDDQGKQLPMEENCLRCHAGHREQLYRDRMYTAGVTCYDCHGDMLAVGEAFPKNYLANKDKLGSVERDDYRVPWFDEPDCGSCHVGDGNKGADKSGGFFSAGVMKRAFDDADWSATTRAVNRSDPDSRRFSAAPLATYQAAIPTDFYYDVDEATGSFLTKTVDTKIDAAVFRFGKDRHGNVACAACHGAAHSVWPNRDPGSNDNVTALQLQGHTGTILECNVCHTADSFAKKEDLDGGQYSGDAQTGILGGPHDMHPVNDPYWWKQADGDTANSDGSTYGGWHNDYAKLPGAKGEDQCAACHGNDHKGTRLSKTPVDRVFDFRGFDGKKLKKAGFKTKVVKVAAGTPIGCDTCHSLETSFKGSPGH